MFVDCDPLLKAYPNPIRFLSATPTQADNNRISQCMVTLGRCCASWHRITWRGTGRPRRCSRGPSSARWTRSGAPVAPACRRASRGSSLQEPLYAAPGGRWLRAGDGSEGSGPCSSGCVQRVWETQSVANAFSAFRCSASWIGLLRSAVPSRLRRGSCKTRGVARNTLYILSEVSYAFYILSEVSYAVSIVSKKPFSAPPTSQMCFTLQSTPSPRSSAVPRSARRWR